MSDAAARAQQLHQYEQLAAGMQALAREVLYPYYQTCEELGFPPALAADLTRDLQMQITDQRFTHGDDEG